MVFFLDAHYVAALTLTGPKAMHTRWNFCLRSKGLVERARRIKRPLQQTSWACATRP